MVITLRERHRLASADATGPHSQHRLWRVARDRLRRKCLCRLGQGGNGIRQFGYLGLRFTPAGGWQAPVRVGSSANIGIYDQAEQPQVAVDAAGNAYVLWVQRASESPVWVARYQVGSGWQPAVSLGAVRRGDPYAPRLAVSGSGQVMALWNAFVPSGTWYRFDLWWSALATPGGSWTSPALLENDDVGDAMNQVLTVDGAGNFHAIWQQQDVSNYRSDLVHRRYTPGVGWEATTTVSTANGTYFQNRFPQPGGRSQWQLDGAVGRLQIG